MTYDARYRPVTNTLTGPFGTIAAYQYGYDDAGNVTAIDDLVDASCSRGFGYDDLHRLVTANGGASLWGAGTYQYDAMGNMTSLALGAMRTASFAYAGTTPKLTSVTENGLPRAVQYDAAGNEILAGTTASSYSPRNHLLESEALRYAYDGRGIRTLTEVTGGQGASLLDDAAVRIADASVVRREPGDDRSLLGRVLHRFFPRTSLSLGVEAALIGPMSLPPTGSRKVNVYLPELQLLTESELTTGTPLPAWDYVWFAGQPLAQIEVATGATRWTFNDHLGTPLLQTDVARAIQEEALVQEVLTKLTDHFLEGSDGRSILSQRMGAWFHRIRLRPSSRRSRTQDESPSADHPSAGTGDAWSASLDGLCVSRRFQPLAARDDFRQSRGDDCCARDRNRHVAGTAT